MRSREDMTQEERTRLEKDQSDTQDELARVREWLRTEVDVDADEGDPDLFEREKNLALVTALERKLESIATALRAVEKGTYGICERCGEAIDPARLEVRPDATLCLKCQLEVERIAHRAAARAIAETAPLASRRPKMAE